MGSQRGQKSAVKLYVTLAGSFEKDAVKVLFLHGFPEGRMTWGPVAAEILERFRAEGKTATVLLPDQRGYNMSEKPSSPYTLSTLVSDMAELLENQLESNQKAYVVCHDWGGPVGW